MTPQPHGSTDTTDATPGSGSGTTPPSLETTDGAGAAAAAAAAAPEADPDGPAPEEERGYTRPSLDPASIQQILDGPYVEVRNLVRRNMAGYAGILTDAEELSTREYRDRVRDIVVELAGTGQTGFGFPERYGGGDDVGASVAAFETLAQGDQSVLVKVGVQFGLFGGAVLQLGTERHHEAYLEDVVRGRVMGCFAMTETGHGSNVQALGTTATYDVETGEFVINTPDRSAMKDYIGNAAAHGDVAAVFAQLEVGGEARGVHAFVVPLRRKGKVLPGITIEDDGLKMGLNGVDNGRIGFDHVRVPREALLDRFAEVSASGVYTSSIEDKNKRFFTMLGTLVQGRVCVGGAGINASKVALTIATRYAVRRRQFETGEGQGEQLLLDYGLHQRRLFPLIARTYALHFAQDVVRAELHEVAHGAAEGPDGDVRKRALESRAAGTKALGTWHGTHAIQQARELCGGAGYLAENRFAALKADTDVYTTFEGDNHVLLQLVAKGLLTDYASDFEDMDQFGMVRFVAGLAVDTVVERTAVHKILERMRDLLPGGEDEWDQEAGLLDSRYQLAMYRWREEHIVSGVARRLKRGIDQGMDAGDVFSRVQDHVIAAARAHSERLVLEAFVERCASLPDGDEKVALSLLCDLHALSGIEADRGWFMEHGRLSSQRSKAISREINDLCRKLRPLAVDLVDAFGVPEEMLRARDLIA